MKTNPHLFNQKNQVGRVLHEDIDAIERISHEIVHLLPNERNQPIVFICIGTDRSTGDSLGPLVGTLLKEKAPFLTFHVYGTLADPIHAVNLHEKLAEIKAIYNNPYIIGIDACLGKVRSIGVIQIGQGPVKPGAAVNKELPPVGEAHITGIVNVSGFMEFMVLQNTRLSLVLNMAQTITDSIIQAHLQYLVLQAPNAQKTRRLT